jgi:hypothetical protein
MGMTVADETLPEIWQRVEQQLAAKRRALSEEEIRACIDDPR